MSQSQAQSQSLPEHKLELENQFILRLPPTQAETLRQALRTGEPLSKRLFVKFDNDIRHGFVRFDGKAMPARLYDLPTIIESYKTLDRKNFYKTADISQILICKEDFNPETVDITKEDLEEEAKKAKYDQIFASVGGAGKREYLYPHGITPPLKNVRKRRFRKTLKKKYVDFSEIEKEVKRLLRFDCEAIETSFDIVEENKIDKAQPATFANDSIASPMGSDLAGVPSAKNSQNLDIHELFGEELSSSDESDDDDDDDDPDEDIEAEQEGDRDLNEDSNLDLDVLDDATAQTTMSNTAADAEIAAEEVAAASDLIAQEDGNEELRQELRRELDKINERIDAQEGELKGLDNQALRMRLQGVLEHLHDQKQEVTKKLEELSYQM